MDRLLPGVPEADVGQLGGPCTPKHAGIADSCGGSMFCQGRPNDAGGATDACFLKCYPTGAFPNPDCTGFPLLTGECISVPVNDASYPSYCAFK